MKKILLFLFMGASILTIAQETEYIHCNCIETFSSDQYKVVSNGVVVEFGKFKSGERTGLWQSKSIKGTIIRNANYLDGLLNGPYELFHFNGNPKLNAEFLNGSPSGQWTYYNAKGKIIKQGIYKNGKPSGIWRIMDKKGRKSYAEYDFDLNVEAISSDGRQYFEKGGVIRDDQSGEWLILYLPKRDIKVETQPLGGYMLSSDLFADFFNIPTILMDTRTQFEFNTTVLIESGVASVVSVDFVDEGEKFDITSHSLPFMVDTNPPEKLWRIEHSEATIRFLRDQVAEYVLIASPWISRAGREEIVIRTPIVINEVKRW